MTPRRPPGGEEVRAGRGRRGGRGLAGWLGHAVCSRRAEIGTEVWGLRQPRAPRVC